MHMGFSDDRRFPDFSFITTGQILLIIQGVPINMKIKKQGVQTKCMVLFAELGKLNNCMCKLYEKDEKTCLFMSNGSSRIFKNHYSIRKIIHPCNITRW